MVDKQTLAIIEVTKYDYLDMECTSVSVHDKLRNKSKEEKVALVCNIIESLTDELDITLAEVMQKGYLL